MLDWILANYMEVLTGVSMIVAGASVLVKFTPTLSDDHVLAWVQKVLSFVALNKAK